MRLKFWRQSNDTPLEPLWHVQLAVVVALVLYLLLPDKLIIGPRWIVPTLEALLLVGLVSVTPQKLLYESHNRRVLAISLAGLITLANIASLVLLVHFLLTGGKTDGHQLILSSIEIYLTNIIIFGLWYWELDRGGPGKRSHLNNNDADFLFPQMTTPDLAPKHWYPTFVDYLYVSATNATAFSPTDTMPLSRQAKLLMLTQSFVSLVTIALVAARAVNILS